MNKRPCIFIGPWAPQSLSPPSSHQAMSPLRDTPSDPRFPPAPHTQSEIQTSLWVHRPCQAGPCLFADLTSRPLCSSHSPCLSVPPTPQVLLSQGPRTGCSLHLECPSLRSPHVGHLLREAFLTSQLLRLSPPRPSAPQHSSLWKLSVSPTHTLLARNVNNWRVGSLWALVTGHRCPTPPDNAWPGHSAPSTAAE